MSLFTVLKYGNTDISSIKALEALPAPILSFYYKTFFGKTITDPHSQAIKLAIFYQISCGEEIPRHKATFVRALLEYEGEDL